MRHRQHWAKDTEQKAQHERLKRCATGTPNTNQFINLVFRYQNIIIKHLQTIELITFYTPWLAHI